MKNETMIIAVMKFQWINLCIRFEDCEFDPCYDIQISYLEEQIEEERILENSYTPEACTIPHKPTLDVEEIPF